MSQQPGAMRAKGERTMPVLNWLKDRGPRSSWVADGTTVVVGTPLTLREAGWAPGPQPRFFEIYRSRGWFDEYVKRAARMGSVPIATFDARPRGQECFSESPWVAGFRGRRGRATFFFADERGNRSSAIDVTQSPFSVVLDGPVSGGISLSGAAGETAGIHVRRDRATLNVRVRAVGPQDPTLAIRLFSAADDPEIVRELLLSEIEDEARSLAGESPSWSETFLEAGQEAMDAFLSWPWRWDISLDQSEVDLQPGESSDVALTVRAPTNGMTALFIEVANQAGEETRVLSDPVVVIRGGRPPRGLDIALRALLGVAAVGVAGKASRRLSGSELA